MSRAELSLQQHSRKPEWRLIEGCDTPGSGARARSTNLISILNVRIASTFKLSGGE
jgi:hypothetical protein